MIKQVALKFEDGTVISKPKPASDMDIYDFIFDNFVKYDCREYRKGFLTSTGHFVDRKEAYKIAKQYNQLKKESEEGILYSEDLKEW